MNLKKFLGRLFLVFIKARKIYQNNHRCEERNILSTSNQVTCRGETKSESVLPSAFGTLVLIFHSKNLVMDYIVLSNFISLSSLRSFRSQVSQLLYCYKINCGLQSLLVFFKNTPWNLSYLMQSVVFYSRRRRKQGLPVPCKVIC